MTVYTTREEIHPKLNDHIERTSSDGESFIAAMPAKGSGSFAEKQMVWFALTTRRLIRFQSHLVKRDVSEFHLSEISRVEHSTRLWNHRWAVSGDGLFQKFTTKNPDTRDFIDHLRRQL